MTTVTVGTVCKTLGDWTVQVLDINEEGIAECEILAGSARAYQATNRGDWHVGDLDVACEASCAS